MTKWEKYYKVRPVGSPKNLKYNAFYFFTYNAKCAEELTCSVYDMYPFVIFLHFDRDSALGVNLHWIPRNKREKFVKTVFEWAKAYWGEKRIARKLRLFYAAIKYDMQLRKLAIFAIRRYLYNRMRNVYEIPPYDWLVIRKLQTKKWGLPKLVYIEKKNKKPGGIVVTRSESSRRG